MQLYVKNLTELTAITAGHPIRQAVRDVPGGDTAVVQIRNVDAETGIEWSSVARTNLHTRRAPDYLKAGDILFAARGQRNVAVVVDTPPPQSVCSPHFFLVRVKDHKVALPEFIAWQLNLANLQQYFAQSATGSYIKSIRRNVLEKAPVLIPSLERQRVLVELARAASREKELLTRLIENRQSEVKLVAQHLLTKEVKRKGK